MTNKWERLVSLIWPAKKTNHAAPVRAINYQTIILRNRIKAL